MKVIHNHLLLIVVFIACFSIFLWKTPFYTLDGPNHKKVAVILSRLDSSPSEAAVYKSNLSWKQTNQLFPLLYSKCFKTISIDSYEKGYFAFFACLLVLSWILFIKVWAPRAIDLWPLILPFTLHPHFFKGFFNYQASIPLCLLALTSLRLWVEQRRPSYLFLFCLMCWFCWLAHPFPFFILAFTLIGLFFEKKEAFLRLIIPSVIVAAFLYGGFITPLLHQSNSISNHWTNLLFLLCGFFLFNFHDYSIATLLISFPYFVLLAALTWHCLKNRQATSNGKFFIIPLLLAYFTFPRSGSGGGHINERFLFFILIFLPLGLSHLNEKKIAAIRVVAIVFFILTCLMVNKGLSNVGREFEKVSILFSDLPTGSRLYSINFKTKEHSLFTDTLRHINSNYGDDKIIFSPTLFAFNDLMPLSRKHASSKTYFPSTTEDFPSSIVSSKFCSPGDFIATSDCASKMNVAINEILEKAKYYDFLFISSPPTEFKDRLNEMKANNHIQLISQVGEYYLYKNLETLPFQPDLKGEPL